MLVGCECSGVVREAFRRLGHDAWSCDIKPAEDGSRYHIQRDVRLVMNDGWDLGIFHPVCRYLTNSGAKHLYLGTRKENGPNEERWMLMREGADFYLDCWQAPIDRVAVENPIWHRAAAEYIQAKATYPASGETPVRPAVVVRASGGQGDGVGSEGIARAHANQGCSSRNLRPALCQARQGPLCLTGAKP